jgi:hypothetical protein
MTLTRDFTGEVPGQNRVPQGWKMSKISEATGLF